MDDVRLSEGEFVATIGVWSKTEGDFSVPERKNGMSIKTLGRLASPASLTHPTA